MSATPMRAASSTRCYRKNSDSEGARVPRGQTQQADADSFAVCEHGQHRDTFVIGKSARPRCFKGSRKLPMKYVANSKAWMLRDIFTAWLDMRHQKRKVCLVLNNCTAHYVPGVELTNVDLRYVPQTQCPCFILWIKELLIASSAHTGVESSKKFL